MRRARTSMIGGSRILFSGRDIDSRKRRSRDMCSLTTHSILCVFLNSVPERGRGPSSWLVIFLMRILISLIFQKQCLIARKKLLATKSVFVTSNQMCSRGSQKGSTTSSSLRVCSSTSTIKQSFVKKYIGSSSRKGVVFSSP